MTDMLVEQPVTLLEYRGRDEGVQVTGVSFPRRIIELIVMPYEVPTIVNYRGRLVEEVCSRGAYDGIEKRGNRVRVNRDHDVRRTVGRAIRFLTSRAEGLVGELRISKTELGDETLALADDRVLDASAGFALLRDPLTGKIRENAEQWETRDRRRLNHLWLGHIALVPDPAYESANVLNVRSTAGPVVQTEATPNLDRVQMDYWRQRAAEIDARYSRR